MKPYFQKKQMIGSQESPQPQWGQHFSSRLSEDLSQTSNKQTNKQTMARKSALCAIRLGRKPAIIIAAVVFTAGAVTMGAAGNKEVLLVGRIILGMGIGVGKEFNI